MWKAFMQDVPLIAAGTLVGLLLVLGIASLLPQPECRAFAADTLPNGAVVVYRDCGDRIIREYPWMGE